MIYQLVIQIFMAFSLIAGLTMLIFTIGYRSKLRRIERANRYILGALLVYSVTIRFLLILPVNIPYFELTSIGFDFFYISLCLFFNINILKRGEEYDDRKNNRSK
jgi:lysylphosphatidylglycerol synthetase-like protein (DUF2156 family)